MDDAGNQYSQIFFRTVLPFIQARVAQWEGGVVHHPDDPGGFTRRGLSTVYNDMTQDELMHMTNEEVDLALWKKYGNPYNLWLWSPGLALVFYDCSVNQGPTAAVKMLQVALNKYYKRYFPPLVVDGIYGSKTEKAILVYQQKYIDNYSFRKLVTEFCALRMERYGRKYKDAFMLGWSNRLMDIAYHAHQLEDEWQMCVGDADNFKGPLLH